MSDHLDALRKMRQNQTQDLSVVESTVPIKRCPFCAEDILIDAIKCKHCGEFLEEHHHKARALFSNTLPIWKLWLLSLGSMGFYDIYWFYKNWRNLEANGTNEKIRPIRWTLGLFVPLWGLILVIRQFQYIKTFSEKHSIKSFSHPGVLGFVYCFISTFIFRMSVTNRLHLPPLEEFLLSNILSAVSLVFLTIPQKTLNKTWEKISPTLPVRYSFNIPEIIFLAIGLILWFLSILGLMLP